MLSPFASPHGERPGAFGDLDIVELELDQLANPEPGVPQDLEDGQVADAIGGSGDRVLLDGADELT